MKDVYDLTKYLVVLQTARLLLQPIGSVLFYFYSKKILVFIRWSALLMALVDQSNGIHGSV